MNTIKPINLKTVRTQPNGGQAEDFSNACLFISIRDFLHSTNDRTLQKHKNISVKELRQIGEFPGANNEMFDCKKSGHLECLEKICNHFSLTVIFYNSQYTNLVFSVGKGRNVVRILQTGIVHFEFIIDYEEVDQLNAIKSAPKLPTIKSVNDSKQESIQKPNPNEQTTDSYLKNITFNIDKIKSTEVCIVSRENEILNMKDTIDNFKSIIANLTFNLDGLKNNIVSIDFVIQDQVEGEIYSNIAGLIEEKGILSNEIKQFEQIKNEYLQKISLLEKKINIHSLEVENFKKTIRTLKDEIKMCNEFINKLIM